MKYALLILVLVVPCVAQLSTMDSVPTLIQSGGNNSTTSAYPNNVVSGNLLIVSLESFSQSTAPTITPTGTGCASTTFNLVINGTTNSGGFAYTWDGPASGSGACTIGFSAIGTFSNNIISEWSNVTSTTDGSIDTTYTGSGVGGTVTTGNVTTAQNGDLFYCFGMASSGSSIYLQTPNSSFGNSTPSDKAIAGYRLTGTNGTYTCSFTTIASDTGHVQAVAFKSTANLKVTTTKIPDFATGVAAKYCLNAEAGSGAYTWSITGGSLSGTGLSLTSGCIQGTPTNSPASCCTFQVADGASHTATATLSFTIGTSYNTASSAQSGSTCFGGITVTAGHVMLLTYYTGTSSGIFLQPLFTSTRITWSSLPLILAIPSGSVPQFGLGEAIGVVNSTGTDTLSGCPSGYKIAWTEFANVQAVFESSVSVATTFTSGTSLTSSAVTLPQTETLYAGASGSSVTGTFTAQAPFTANTAAAAYGDGYEIGASAGANTVTFSSGSSQASAINLLGLRPSVSGTAPISATGFAAVY